MNAAASATLSTPRSLAASAVVLLTLCVGFVDLPSTLTGWLVAATFWVGVPAGSLAWVMVHHLTGGRWGSTTRPSLEAAAGTLPLAAVLLLPLLAFPAAAFPWGDAAVVAADPVLRHQQAWMGPWFVRVRVLAYVAAGCGLAWAFLGNRRPMGRLAAPGLIAYGVVGSLAAVDLLMTRTSGYVSSMFGFLVVIGWVYTAWAFAVLATASGGGRGPAVDDDRRGDLGGLLATCALLWVYLSFCQFLISWLGNRLPEARWYVDRGFGGVVDTGSGWAWLSLALVLLGFAIPFGALLFRSVKRSPRGLPVVAATAVASRWIDSLWIAGPGDVPAAAGGFGWVAAAVAVVVTAGFGLVWWPLWAALRTGTPPMPEPEPEPDEPSPEPGAGVARAS